MRPIPHAPSQERVALFIDHPKTLDALRRADRQIDLLTLRDYLVEGRCLVEAFAYIATPPQPEQQVAHQAMLERLRQHGLLIRSQPGRLLPDGRLTAPFDLDIALDVQEFVAHSRYDEAYRLWLEVYGRILPMADDGVLPSLWRAPGV